MPTPHHTGAVLSDELLVELQDKNHLDLPAKYIQPSSFDLPIGNRAYQASCIPSLAQGFNEKTFVKHYCHSPLDLDKDDLVIMPGVNYLIKLDIKLDLPKTIWGYANPKSSAGRCDLDCTLLCEAGTEYNAIPAGYAGSLYLIVAAQSFPVILHKGDTLMQVRLYKGIREILTGSQLKKIHLQDPLVCNNEKPTFNEEGILLHLDLTGNPSNLVSIPNGSPVDLSERHTINPRDYFREKRLESDRSLMLEPHEFILATTKERLRILPWMSTEMIPYTEKQGPFRSHFAGYFDPGFGYDKEELEGSGVVLEIRNLTDRRLQLSDGQGICVMRYESMKKIPARLYGETSKEVAEHSHYQFQSGIKLAKYFAAWQM